MNEFKGSQSYVASEELMRAVNIAMVLEKPLLIKGEPGTGKTMLAEAISAALGKKLIIWNIKSTTKAQDGLYVYDVVQRLYDSQFGGEGVDNIEKYVKLGKLGDAGVYVLMNEQQAADWSQKGFQKINELQESVNALLMQIYECENFAAGS